MKKIISFLFIILILSTLFTGCTTNRLTKEDLEFLMEESFNPPKNEIYEHIQGNIKQEIIYNENGITLVAKGFDFSSTDPKFIFKAINNSKYPFDFKVENVSINNFMIYAQMEENLLSGEKREISMTFVDDNFFKYRLKEIEDIEFTINMAGYNKKYTTGKVLLSTGLQATELEEVTNGQKILKEEDIKITYLDMEYKEENTTLYFCIENRNTQEITVSAIKRKAKIGEKTVEISFNHDVLPYKNKIAKLIINNEDLQDVDKSKITSLSTELMIFDTKTRATILKIGQVTVNDLQK